MKDELAANTLRRRARVGQTESTKESAAISAAGATTGTLLPHFRVSPSPDSRNVSTQRRRAWREQRRDQETVRGISCSSEQPLLSTVIRLMQYCHRWGVGLMYQGFVEGSLSDDVVPGELMDSINPERVWSLSDCLDAVFHFCP